MIEPKSICIDASTVCQLKCQSCPTANGETGKSLGSGFLKFKDFKIIVDDNPEIFDIELSNWGEVFLNKELLQIIKYAYINGIRLTAENGTNMNNVAEDIPEALVRYKFRKVTCSLDGASQETYSMYRVNGDFEQVIKNIKKINWFKKKYNSFHPVLQWQFIPFGHNEHEIDKARKMAKELNMLFKVKLSWDDLYTETFSPIKNATTIRKASSTGTASREEFQERYSRYYTSNVCLRFWSKPRVNYDGKLLVCSINYWGDYGNVLKDGLNDCFNGKKANYAREMLMGKREELPQIPCSRCKIYKKRKETNNWISDEDIEKILTSHTENRKSILLKNKLLKYRIINKLIKRSDDKYHYQKENRNHQKKKVSNPKSEKILISDIHHLNIPIIIPNNKKWKPCPVFAGITSGWSEISCHASALAKDNSPHTPHKHMEEEILLLLSGSIKLILPQNNDSSNNGNIDLIAGQFVYYPSFFPHTLFTTSDEPANYLMLKWNTSISNKNPELVFNHFNIQENYKNLKSKSSKIIFEGSTLYLQKLHCHITSLKPYKGYEAHSDNYDVAIIVLEGEVETLGKRARPHDVIFYASGEPHGMYNPTDRIAKYIVFEFHSTKLSFLSKISNRTNYILHKSVNTNFWKKKLKRLYMSLVSLFS